MITRRSFLKLGGSSLVSLIAHPVGLAVYPIDDDPPGLVGKARVAAQVVYRYSEPSFRSQRIEALKRDLIIDIYEEVVSPKGPDYNPRWYRLLEGYAHSGHLQRVDGAGYHYNPLLVIPEGGQLGEVCVPFTQSYRYLRSEGWKQLYRLYYRSVHWITGLESGLRRGRSGREGADTGAGDELAVLRDPDREVDDGREHEVHPRARHRDEEAAPGSLLEEAAAAVGGRELLVRVVARHLHVPAQRQRRDPVLGLPPLEPEDPRAEPQREADDLHPHELGDEEVPQLVDEDEPAQHHEEGEGLEEGIGHALVS